MTPALTGSPRASESNAPFSWITIAWVSALIAACYAPILLALVRQWNNDPDMGHGFFVPVIAAYIAWQKREELASVVSTPNWWGLAIMLWGAFQLYIATLGAELVGLRFDLQFQLLIGQAIWQHDFFCGQDLRTAAGTTERPRDL